MCLSELRKLIVLAYVLLAPLELMAAGGAVHVRLGAELAAPAESVALGEIATVRSDDAELTERVGGLVISQFPTDQTAMYLPASYLARRIQEVLPAGATLDLQAPAQILLKLERKGVSAEALAEAIARLVREQGRVPEWVETKVEILGGLENLREKTLSDYRLEPAGQVASWKGDLAFRLNEKDASSSRPSWVRARVRWFGHVWAAKRDLSYAQAPSAADFDVSRVELTQLREEAAGATENLEKLLQGARYRRVLRAGAPLVKAALERRPDVKSGQNLRVIFVSESGVRVSADGALLGAGSVGEEVKARLRSSRKVVTGRLTDGNTVEVNL